MVGAAICSFSSSSGSATAVAAVAVIEFSVYMSAKSIFFQMKKSLSVRVAESTSRHFMMALGSTASSILKEGTLENSRD